MRDGSWELCPALVLLGLPSPRSGSSAFPGPAVSLTLSRQSMVLTKEIYNWGQCSAGHFGRITMQFMSAALVLCESLFSLSVPQLLQEPSVLHP